MSAVDLAAPVDDTGLCLRQLFFQLYLDQFSRSKRLQVKRSLQNDVRVGDPQWLVDLVFLPAEKVRHRRPAIGIVDLSHFEHSLNQTQDIIDYYFQLQRAVPPIKPYFLFAHELLSRFEELTEQLAANLGNPV